MDEPNFLPDDLAACQRLLLAAFQQSVELEQQVADAKRQAAEATQQATELGRVLDETAASYQALQQAHAATLDELAWYRRWTFGRRRERFAEDEGQGHLFELDSPLWGESPVPTTPAPEAGNEVKAHHRRQKRQIDWDKLPQIRHNHDLEVADQTCSSCGRPMKCIGEDVTRELEYQPAKLEAHLHVRPKYACPRCQDGVSAAPLPPRPIPGGIAGPGLITEVFVGKFGDHLPLYRLEDILARYGVYLSRSTLCDWMKAVAYLFRPLYELQRQRVLQSSVMWTDDTHVTVLGGEQGSFKGYFWTYLGDEQHPYSVYDFTASRSRAGPARFLAGYSGYLHADAYTGYDAMFLDVASGVVEVACWRMPGGSFSTRCPAIRGKPTRCWNGSGNFMTSRTGLTTWRSRCATALRLAESSPILDRIEVDLAELARSVLPKSNLAKAVTYARNQWEALRRYTADGRLTIDNNVSERTLRHQAVGRRNWLFLGNEAAGPRAAVLYTILAGAKRHRIEPWTYVRDLLLRLHADDPCLEDMLPDRWAATHPEAILSHRLHESRTKAIRTRARRAHRRARAR